MAIFKYINTNKDQGEYNFKYDIANSVGVHVVEIKNNGSIVISMHRNNNNTFFWLKYNLQGNSKIVRPCQQNCFDEFFISKMYHKMLNNYIAKNGMPHNTITR